MTKKDLKDLELIKKLLILHILKSGSTPHEIRDILKMSGTDFKKMFPKNVKKYFEK